MEVLIRVFMHIHDVFRDKQLPYHTHYIKYTWLMRHISLVSPLRIYFSRSVSVFAAVCHRPHSYSQFVSLSLSLSGFPVFLSPSLSFLPPSPSLFFIVPCHSQPPRWLPSLSPSLYLSIQHLFAAPVPPPPPQSLIFPSFFFSISPFDNFVRQLFVLALFFLMNHSSKTFLIARFYFPHRSPAVF